MLMTSGQSVIGRKRTQFLYLQLLTSSVTTPQSAREPTTTCLGGHSGPELMYSFLTSDFPLSPQLITHYSNYINMS